MAVSQELLDILVCPETKQPVALADAALLARVNERVRSGDLQNRGGDPVGAEVQAGLVREDGKILYLIEDDIPVRLIEESIELD